MPVRLARRMCLSCGFDGRAIQNNSRETEWACPRCGSDLYARPPKSYAELEALSDSNPGAPAEDMPALREERRSLRGLLARAPRWAWLAAGTVLSCGLFGLGLWLGRLF